jgi:WD40 repeat protein
LFTDMVGSTEWDAASGNRLVALPGQSATVTDLAFRPDGSRLATATEDGAVRVWDPDSGEELVVLRGHDAVVGSVAFNPDGTRLASVAADGVVRVWTLDVDELVEIAERELTRTLTDAECQQYLRTERCPQA